MRDAINADGHAAFTHNEKLKAVFQNLLLHLPAGEKWINIWDHKEYEGGQAVTVDLPIDQIPVFTKASHPMQALLDFKEPEVKQG
ncbi:hypothetical protein [Limosilactobacillus mucosae]|uniref:hypothetical protein n=1 Tax=Limosilactobacillus mucosae TaxID=97478 RepID=UPI0025A45D4E|nr:hypothetical protein [Limosilactobacillus mucosae]MDM8220800.1 hypothetical protein [Limosilactobacillus mucosae]MDM8315408.1 hypothetical protein [Limosilactobacillus mucosae]